VSGEADSSAARSLVDLAVGDLVDGHAVVSVELLFDPVWALSVYDADPLRAEVTETADAEENARRPRAEDLT